MWWSCHISTWISHRYTYVPPILNPPPTSLSNISLWAVTKHHHSVGKSKNTSGSTFYTVLWLVTQSYPTLFDPIDCVPLSMEILQARILEWLAISYSRGCSQPRNQTHISCIAVGFLTVWATRETQVYWSGHSIPSPGDHPDPEVEPGSLAHGLFTS